MVRRLLHAPVVVHNGCGCHCHPEVDLPGSCRAVFRSIRRGPYELSSQGLDTIAHVPCSLVNAFSQLVALSV